MEQNGINKPNMEQKWDKLNQMWNKNGNRIVDWRKNMTASEKNDNKSNEQDKGIWMERNKRKIRHQTQSDFIHAYVHFIESKRCMQCMQ